MNYEDRKSPLSFLLPLTSSMQTYIHSLTSIFIHTHAHRPLWLFTENENTNKVFFMLQYFQEVDLSPLNQQSHDIHDLTGVCFRWDINSTSSLMPLLFFLLLIDRFFLMLNFNNGHGNVTFWISFMVIPYESTNLNDMRMAIIAINKQI